jgi:hypothetical protein
VLPLRSPIIPTRSSLTCHCQKLPPTVDHPRDHHLPQKFLLSPPLPSPSRLIAGCRPASSCAPILATFCAGDQG